MLTFSTSWDTVHANLFSSGLRVFITCLSLPECASFAIFIIDYLKLRKVLSHADTENMGPRGPRLRGCSPPGPEVYTPQSLYQ